MQPNLLLRLPMALASLTAAMATLSTATEAPRVNGWYPCSLSEAADPYALSTTWPPPAFECAKVEVPLCHDDDICTVSKTIELFVKRKLASESSGSTSSDSSNNRSNKSVWFVQGGPGASSVVMEQSMVNLYATMNESINVYTMDHRGTGRSAYLQCDAAQASAGGSPGGHDVLLQELPACVADIRFELQNQTAAFSVTSAAHDLVTLISLFEDGVESPSVHLYGVSYGSFLVERVMHLAPALVKGYILDGVVEDTNTALFQWNLNILPPTQRFLEACVEAGDKCPLSLSSADTAIEELLAIYDEIDADFQNECANKMIGQSMPSFSLRELFSLLVRDPLFRELVPSILMRIHRCSDQDVEDLTLVLLPIIEMVEMAYGMSVTVSEATRTVLPWPYKWSPMALQSTTGKKVQHQHHHQLQHHKHHAKAQKSTTTPMLLHPLDPLSEPSTMLFYLISFSEMWTGTLPTVEQIDEWYQAGPFSVQAATAAEYCLLTGRLGNISMDAPAELNQSLVCENLMATLMEEASLWSDAKVEEGEITTEIVQEMKDMAPLTYEKDLYWNKTASLPDGAGALLFFGGLDFQTPIAMGERQYERIGGEGNKMAVEFEYGGHGSGFLPSGFQDDSNCGPRIIASFVEANGDVGQVDTSCVDEAPKLLLTDDLFVQMVATAKLGYE